MRPLETYLLPSIFYKSLCNRKRNVNHTQQFFCFFAKDFFQYVLDFVFCLSFAVGTRELETLSQLPRPAHRCLSSAADLLVAHGQSHRGKEGPGDFLLGARARYERAGYCDIYAYSSTCRCLHTTTYADRFERSPLIQCPGVGSNLPASWTPVLQCTRNFSRTRWWSEDVHRSPGTRKKSHYNPSSDSFQAHEKVVTYVMRICLLNHKFAFLVSHEVRSTFAFFKHKCICLLNHKFAFWITNLRFWCHIKCDPHLLFQTQMYLSFESQICLLNHKFVFWCQSNAIHICVFKHKHICLLNHKFALSALHQEGAPILKNLSLKTKNYE